MNAPFPLKERGSYETTVATEKNSVFSKRVEKGRDIGEKKESFRGRRGGGSRKSFTL
jgi:hypothetical protein